MKHWAENFFTVDHDVTYTHDGQEAQVSELVLNDTVQNGSFAANALTIAVMEKMVDALAVAKDKQQMVVLANDGDTPFCGGLDSFDLLRFLARAGSCEEMLDKLVAVYGALARHPYSTVAWVAGSAAGGGVGLALCCDVVLAKKSVKKSGKNNSVRLRIPAGGYRELANVLLPIIKWRRERKGTLRPDLNLESLLGCNELVTEFPWSELVDNWIADGDSREQKIPPEVTWPPVEVEDRQYDVPAETKIARGAAQEPEATRAIAAGVIYEAARATERQLAKHPIAGKGSENES